MKKLLNKKGFTLMEMLIVVAIIVILVAISIPAFSGSLDKANKAADEANLRTAKGVIVAEEMGDSGKCDRMIYDIKEGKLVTAGATIVESMKGSCSKHKNCHIIASGGSAVWSDGSTTCD